VEWQEGFFRMLCRRFDDRSGWRSSAGHICRINDADYRLLSPTSVSHVRRIIRCSLNAFDVFKVYLVGSSEMDGFYYC